MKILSVASLLLQAGGRTDGREYVFVTFVAKALKKEIRLVTAIIIFVLYLFHVHYLAAAAKSFSITHFCFFRTKTTIIMFEITFMHHVMVTRKTAST
jgi:hypothetical protein